jgi:hypothetical protein
MKRKLLWTALLLLVLPVIGALLYGVVKSALRGDLIGVLFFGSVLFASVVSGLAVALSKSTKRNADRRQKQPGGGAKLTTLAAVVRTVRRLVLPSLLCRHEWTRIGSGAVDGNLLAAHRFQCLRCGAKANIIRDGQN